MLRRLIILISFYCLTIPLAAQFDIADFRWELADIAFSYPATWDEPFAVQRFGVESVILAQSDVRNSERAPEIPFIVMALQPNAETDANTLLQERMTEFDIRPTITIPTSILNREGLWTRGNSRDESYFGIGASVQLGDNILSIVGHSPSEQSNQLEYNFDVLTRSLIRGQANGDDVPFGLVWSNVTDIDDGDAAFTSVGAIALDEANQTLYVAEDILGLLRFDMLSGRLEYIIPNTEFNIPASIALGLEGTVYIGDIGCSCIHVYQDDTWQAPIIGFGEGAPMSIITTADGTLYATDDDGLDILVRQYTTEAEAVLFIDEPLDEQPILFLTSDHVQLLSRARGELFQLNGTGFTLYGELPIETSPQTVKVASDGSYVLATNSTIEFYTSTGFFIKLLDITDYSLGTGIRGFTLGTDGTLYIASSNNAISEMLALSQRVAEARFGLQTLFPYRVSGGVLSENNPEDTWLIEGNNGDQFSLFVQGYSELGDFQYNMTLLAPDGSEIITVDDTVDTSSPLDRSIQNITLSANGIYEVHINHSFSRGSYELVLVEVEPFILNLEGASIWGEISETHPVDIWSFEASAGTIITLTVEATNPTALDPVVSLADAQYNQLAQNNNADNSTLENTAQIPAFTLQRTGTYYIEASRVNGFGKYHLTIDIIDPDS